MCWLCPPPLSVLSKKEEGRASTEFYVLLASEDKERVSRDRRLEEREGRGIPGLEMLPQDLSVEILPRHLKKSPE